MSNYTKEELVRFGLTPEMAEELQPLDYDPEADIQGPVLGPLPDGNYILSLRLREPREGETNPMVKKGAKGLFTYANIEVRQYRPENEEKPFGPYLNNYMPNSIKWDNQPTSDLVAFCKAVGKPAPAGLDPLGLAKHVEGIFRSVSDETGLLVKASTRWEMSYAEVDENGLQVLKANGKPAYVTIRGEQAIKKAVGDQAAAEAAEQGLDPARAQAYISNAVANAHIFTDPLTGEERQVRPAIHRILGPFTS